MDSVSFALSVAVISASLVLAGCDSEAPRLVEESDSISFDDIAAQAAADSELSEVEQ